LRRYDTHKWDTSRFSGTRSLQWSDPSTPKRFLDSISEKVGVKTLDDWKNVSPELVIYHGGAVRSQFASITNVDLLVSFLKS
jgi:hypothetical protein